ncbi:MAG: efflux RND transporter permease subunit, partial [Steroidobacteraceae bacterium]
MIERILDISVRHRGLVLLAVLAIASVGFWSYGRLPIDAVPDITNVQVIVNIDAPGYTPLEAEQRLSLPLETAMAGLPRLSYTRSLSRYGLAQVTAVFQEGTDIYFARQLVAERVLAARGSLPPGREAKLGPIATGLGEIFMFTVDADLGARNADGSTVTPTDLRTVHDWIIRPQLLRVPGVVEINPIGGYRKEILIAPDPARLLSLGISHSELIAAIQGGNDNRGAGYIEHNGAQWLLRVPGQAKSLAELENLVVRSESGVPLRVGDVATVSLGEELRSGAATQNGREVVMSTVFMLIGENSRDVAHRVAEKLTD